MVKLFNDTFNINEIIDATTEVLLESEFTIADNMPDIEKIINVEGKTKINDVSASTDNITVEGKLIYNIIYRSNDEKLQSVSDEIPFKEEVSAKGITDDMEAFAKAYIDYIDAEELTDRSFLNKSVVILDTNAFMKRPVTYVSYLESDGSMQAKTKNISYTDTIADIKEEVSINDAVELSKGSGEISKILKSESDVYVTNIDVLNDKMLVEGMCKVGFMYTEDNDNQTTGYVSEEFPFTHYLELKGSDENLLKDISISLKDMTYSKAENFDNEKKLIEFTVPFTVNASLYETKDRNIITDCYSTDYELEIQSEKLNVSSIKDISNEIIKYENNFDVPSGTIKDIYSVDVSPKVSDKRMDDGKYTIDGFLDINMLYVNGNTNKMDKVSASLPFTAALPIKEDADLSQIQSDVKTNKCSAYRKGANSVNLNCDINVALKIKDSDEITIIKDVAETAPIDRSKMPSLIFRVVQQGESLWDIAKSYSLSINSLKELNDVAEDSVLTAGDKIIIARSV